MKPVVSMEVTSQARELSRSARARRASSRTRSAARASRTRSPSSISRDEARSRARWRKLLRSALANAEEKNDREKAGIDVDNLVVTHVFGRRRRRAMWRIRARAQGRAAWIQRRTQPRRPSSWPRSERVGQKVHPFGFRLGILYGWQSNWFAERSYAEQLHEDLADPRVHQEEALSTPASRRS